MVFSVKGGSRARVINFVSSSPPRRHDHRLVRKNNSSRAITIVQQSDPSGSTIALAGPFSRLHDKPSHQIRRLLPTQAERFGVEEAYRLRARRVFGERKQCSVISGRALRPLRHVQFTRILIAATLRHRKKILKVLTPLQYQRTMRRWSEVEQGGLNDTNQI
jgi:hypothetical protein